MGVAWAGPIYTRAPDDLTSFAVTVDAGDSRTSLGILSVNGRLAMDWTGSAEWNRRRLRTDEEEVEETGDTGVTVNLDGYWAEPFYHGPEISGTMVLPMNLASMPEPGCVAIVPLAMDPKATGVDGTLYVVSKRTPTTARALRLNIVVAEGTEISDDELDEAVAVMKTLYDAGDALDLVETKRFSATLETGPFVRYSGPALNALRATVFDGHPSAMNLFFIEDFLGDAGTLGIAAGIPGPMGLAGTSGSGVVVAVAGHRDVDGVLDIQTMGETMAHEVGHQLGLFTPRSPGATALMCSPTRSSARRRPTMPTEMARSRPRNAPTPMAPTSCSGRRETSPKTRCQPSKPSC